MAANVDAWFQRRLFKRTTQLNSIVKRTTNWIQASIRTSCGSTDMTVPTRETMHRAASLGFQNPFDN
eukprot:6299915-Amphidinium_carterae.1